MESKIVALMSASLNDGRDLFDFILNEDEEVLLSFRSVRDRLIVTNKKLLMIFRELLDEKRNTRLFHFRKLRLSHVKAPEHLI